MGWLDPLRNNLVAIDSAPLIYFIEEHPKYLPALAPFFELVEAGAIQCVTSVITITEVLILPLRSGRSDLAVRYRDILLGSPRISVLPVSGFIAALAAEVRAASNLRTPDAIHLATALDSGAIALLTNDRAIGQMGQLQILTLDDIVARE